MDSVMKGLMGQCPQNFWARTAPDCETLKFHSHREHGRFYVAAAGGTCLPDSLVASSNYRFKS